MATELGKKLAKRGHEIHFITSSIPFRLDNFSSNIFYHEVEVNQYSVFRYPPYDLTLASKMAEVAEREQLDILHAHYAVPHAICAILAKQMVGEHLKVVTTLHGTDVTILGYDLSLQQLIKFGIEHSDQVTAVSRDLIRQTQQLVKTDKTMTPIYNFVDETVYYRHDAEYLKSVYGIQSNEKVLIHISNFRDVKRVPDVIKTFARVQDAVPSKLLLVGEGPSLSAVIQLVNDYGLKDKVLFLGKQENVAELLSISDLALLPSSKESFGLILLEAAACGVPAVGTNIGGIPEVIHDGKTGYLCPIGDIDQFVAKSLAILQHPEHHKQMSQAAVLEAKTRFHSDEIVSQYEDVYCQALR